MSELRPPSFPSGSLPESVPCPFCDTRETKLISPFGSQLSVAQYWCRRCRTGFDFVKWGEAAPSPPSPRPPPGTRGEGGTGP